MRPAKLSLATVKQWHKRQPVDRFSPDYVPAIWGTREEAPRKSIPCILQCKKLRREVHTLSETETLLALIALYHPRVWELQEQRLLALLPSAHPLFSHPKAHGLHLPSMPGTMTILEELGRLSDQPALRKPDAADGELPFYPVPWIGDLLLFLEDDEGPYLVNWSAKSDDAAFASFPNIDPTRGSRRSERKQLLRHEVEHLHYARAGIPTRRMTRCENHHQLLAYLKLIYGASERCPELPEKVRRRLISQFQLAMLNQIPPIELFSLPSFKRLADESTLRDVLLSAIWRRELRVDLFHPILIDEPLIAEESDILVRYGAAFSRNPM